MIFSGVLSYLAEKSGIPLWIIDGQAELRFSTVADAKLGEKKNIQKFLSSFIGAEAAQLFLFGWRGGAYSDSRPRL